jgi:Mn-dependent DtxR family transcriptional regulator
LIDEVASIESAEASIDSFIERRAKASSAENAREMMWKESVRKHHNRLRDERLWARLDYHRAMLDAHTRSFEELLRRHRVGLRLCEEALGLPTSEETRGDAA